MKNNLILLFLIAATTAALTDYFVSYNTNVDSVDALVEQVERQRNSQLQPLPSTTFKSTSTMLSNHTRQTTPAPQIAPAPQSGTTIPQKLISDEVLTTPLPQIMPMTVMVNNGSSANNGYKGRRNEQPQQQTVYSSALLSATTLNFVQIARSNNVPNGLAIPPLPATAPMSIMPPPPGGYDDDNQLVEQPINGIIPILLVLIIGYAVANYSKKKREFPY